MNLLSHLIAADAASPRLTIYDETQGTRLDFSATTLDNWAAKVANMLREECDLEEGACIRLELPVAWQAVAITLGALAAGIRVTLSAEEADVVFCAPENASDYQGSADVVVVTDDPFGRGVEETGGHLPPEFVDFGPTVRFYGDVFSEPGPTLVEVVPPGDLPAGARTLGTGWSDWAGLCAQVLEPLAAGGSAVVVAGPVSTERLHHISEVEKVTLPTPSRG